MAILFVALAMCGCMTKAKSRLEAQNAFLAGQNAALRQQQAQAAMQTPSVTVLGQVQNSQVPWVAGLTLAQAVATANYIGPGEPKQILITRGGKSETLDANSLLNGTDIPLEIGDVIELR
ncbi:MAG TPA: hypothetical protein VIK53_04250 [Verrucomicrobiae bacterium]